MTYKSKQSAPTLKRFAHTGNDYDQLTVLRPFMSPLNFFRI